MWALAEEAPHLMMDPDDHYAGGKSFSPINATSYNALSIQALFRIINGLACRFGLNEDQVLALAA